jgi:DNA modification methylase
VHGGGWRAVGGQGADAGRVEGGEDVVEAVTVKNVTSENKLFDDVTWESMESEGLEKTLSLAERFVVPPFSVLNARQGYWQRRKAEWLCLGIKGEIGRNRIGGRNVTFGKNSAMFRVAASEEFIVDGKQSSGGNTTSIFDPVLTEAMYRWFCPIGGNILDPFAGGSVRGIVASVLGYAYIGVELRLEQVEANIIQGKEIIPDRCPQWIQGDSKDLRELVSGRYDFVFSCPPYYDLEVYSGLCGELSALPTYKKFLASYRNIISSSIELLRENRFACFVVGDIRDKEGYYCNFVSDTIGAFQSAGAKLYNEIILVTAVGSLPIRTSRNFPAGRKVGKTHQNVLVFVKGDWRKATQACLAEEEEENDF